MSGTEHERGIDVLVFFAALCFGFAFVVLAVLAVAVAVSKL